MERRDVPESWIGRRVELIPLDERGWSGRELHGWLRGVRDDGIEFAPQFYSDSAKKLVSARAQFWPWERVGGVVPLEP